MTFEDHDFLAGSCIPDSDRTIGAGRGDVPTVRTEGNRQDGFGPVPLQGQHLFAGFDGPYLDRAPIRLPEAIHLPSGLKATELAGEARSQCEKRLIKEVVESIPFPVP